MPRRGSCAYVLISCTIGVFSDVSAGPAASQPTSTLTDKEKLGKLQGEGLHDVDEFMDSFGQGQDAADDIKCDLCRHLMFDLHAGVSNLRAEGEVRKARSTAAEANEAFTLVSPDGIVRFHPPRVCLNASI